MVLLEEVYSFYLKGYFKKDGFLNVPLKPMYGIAMCLLIYSYDRLEIDGFIMGMLFVIIPSSIEYLTGYLLRRVFNKEYWNYKFIKYNFQGLICFKFSVYWAIITASTLIFIQPLVKASYLDGIVFLSVLSIVACIFMVVDSTDVIVNRTKAKR
jgi:uncharacterized membrane protein